MSRKRNVLKARYKVPHGTKLIGQRAVLRDTSAATLRLDAGKILLLASIRKAAQE